MGQFEWCNNYISFHMDESTGKYAISFRDEAVFQNLDTWVKAEDGSLIKGSELSNHEIEVIETEDDLGKGVMLSVRHCDSEKYVLSQEFMFYEEGFMTIRLVINSAVDTNTNYMGVICAEDDGGVLQMGNAQIQFLSAPFDNDKWAKFVDYPAQFSKMSYEFTAIHLKDQTSGIVIGSIDHNSWKTGIEIKAAEMGCVNSFHVIAGVATEDTRDLMKIPHGRIKGNTIISPRIFMGYYISYQDGFQIFGRCNAKVSPPISWDGPVPFGWNSWAALMGTLSFDKYKEASDFMETIKYSFCDTNGSQYINFDACWQRFVTKMNDSVAYVQDKGQMPGSYMGPFITSPPFDREVPGTDGNYLFEDLLLRNETGDVLEPIDGLYSMDPTHPGTLAHMRYETQRIIKWGFRYVKVDFLGHGCREGKFYNKEITTGVQAYNYGMKYFNSCLSVEKAGYPIFLSLSIDPIFPSGYGHARRISCDAFGTIDQSAYLNNCITYLWWMNDCLYRFNDPDHIVLYKTHDKHSTTFEEGKTRFNTGVICGTLMINSDDYSIKEARERAQYLLTNNELNEAARNGASFRPVSGNQGEFAADVFMRRDEQCVLVAVFNYSLSDEKNVVIPLCQIGLEEDISYRYKDLWSKEEGDCKNDITVSLKPAQSTIIRII